MIELAQGRPRSGDSLMHQLDLPRGDDRELVVDRDRVYELNGEDSRTLTAVQPRDSGDRGTCTLDVRTKIGDRDQEGSSTPAVSFSMHSEGLGAPASPSAPRRGSDAKNQPCAMCRRLGSMTSRRAPARRILRRHSTQEGECLRTAPVSGSKGTGWLASRSLCSERRVRLRVALRATAPADSLRERSRAEAGEPRRNRTFNPQIKRTTGGCPHASTHAIFLGNPQMPVRSRPAFPPLSTR